LVIEKICGGSGRNFMLVNSAKHASAENKELAGVALFLQGLFCQFVLARNVTERAGKEAS
jgi:hypothetical protein